MKSLLVTFALIGSSAFALDGTPCTSQDWKVIVAALGSEVSNGKQYVGPIQGMIAEEMGPLCTNVTPTDVAGIPGNQYYEYSLQSGERAYLLHIVVGGVEEPGTRISIEKR